MKINEYKKSAVFLLLAASILLLSCAKYERQVVPFKLPSAYPNATQAAGAEIAARAYDNKDEAASAFGFDILGAGVLPVQVIFDNKGTHKIEIIGNQTFLVDVDNNLWPVLDAGLAYDRIEKKTEFGKLAPEAGKGGLLGGTAGAIIGAAIGIVSGRSVGEAAMRGAAVGAAAGLTIGGAKGLSDPEARHAIRDDLQTRSLENRAVTPQEVAYGFIFFPGESKKAKELRLRVREVDTGKVHSLVLKF
ncbi:MAG: hypothetical protein ACE14T_01465 [Syntrophales bacterium]